MAAKKIESVVINDINDARAWGKKVGVVFPDGKGRPPMKKLLNTLVELGLEITPTEYFSGTWAPRVPTAEPGKAEYEISHTVQKRVMREIVKNGKTRKVPGKVEAVAETHRLNVATIRELSGGEHTRGRISESAVKTAFAQYLGVPEADLVDVKVARVVEAVDAEKRPVRAAKPAKAATLEEETEEASEDVSEAPKPVDAELVEA